MNVCAQGGNEEVFFSLSKILSQEFDLLMSNITAQLENFEDSSYCILLFKDIRCYILSNSQYTIVQYLIF